MWQTLYVTKLVKDITDKIFESKTLVDSSIEVTLQNVDTRGGFGNKLLNIYYHSAEMNITLTDAQWNLDYIKAIVGSEETLTDGEGTITIKSDMVPSIVGLQLTAKLAGDTGTKTGIIGEVVIDVPKAALDGNFTISMTADGVSNTPLKARALESSKTVGDDTVYYYATIKEELDE